MEAQQLIPHLFRTESARIMAVLCRTFGLSDLQLAEDVVSETFFSAMQVWPYQGLPANPQAWLYTVAKNKAKNALLRQRLYAEKVYPRLESEAARHTEFDFDLSETNITDSQLQMLFAVCHPSLRPEGQISLALRILCGFGIDEIANAFVTNKETVNKRLHRAREKLRMVRVQLEFPPAAELDKRLEAVLLTLYLLFSEGYYSETDQEVLRRELCQEAMRLTQLLLDCPQTNQPAVHALFALMCFQASRFEARKGPGGEMILYEEQDERLWDMELVRKGAFHLHTSAAGNELSKFHLEAGIAYWHTFKSDQPEKWAHILELYNYLLTVAYSPVAALNRTFALAKVKGNGIAIAVAKKLDLQNNPYYHTLLGVLYEPTDPPAALASFERALRTARTAADRQAISRRIAVLGRHKP